MKKPKSGDWMKDLFNRLNSSKNLSKDKNICGGKYVIKGTRITLDELNSYISRLLKEQRHDYEILVNTLLENKKRILKEQREEILKKLENYRIRYTSKYTSKTMNVIKISDVTNLIKNIK